MNFSENISNSSLLRPTSQPQLKLAGTPYFIAEITLASMSVVGNTFILLAFLLNRKLRTISHMYIASLAVSDFCMGAFGIPILLLALQGLPRNYPLCMALLTFVLLLDFCSVFSLLALTFDRYYAICWPLHYNAYMTPKLATIILGVAWIIPLILALIMPLGWNYGDPSVDECVFLDLVSLDYLTFNLFVGITTPFLMMCFMYIGIFRVVQRQIKEIAKIHNVGSFTSNTDRDESNSALSEARKNFNRAQKERRTAILFGSLLLFFAFTWGPIFLMDTLLYFGVYISQFVINFCVALSHFNSAFNPVIYCFKGEFRRMYTRWLCRGCGNQRVGIESSETNK